MASTPPEGAREKTVARKKEPPATRGLFSSLLLLLERSLRTALLILTWLFSSCAACSALNAPLFTPCAMRSC